MKKFFVLIAAVLTVMSVQAQQIVVPETMQFAGLHLKLKDSGRKEIQKYVDALHKHPGYFENKVNRTDTYFPIIERIFREEGVPEDFKYLAVQESGLVPDAVSTSNAVGFWQFKKEAAFDFGLQINDYVDERKHILESSRGAAKYLNRSNHYYKNWINTLLSYNLGFTGAKSYAKSSDFSASSMEITDKTHVYVLTFLAHKIAFENAIGKKAEPIIVLHEVKANPGQTLFEIAKANHIDQEQLESYNKWLSGSAIPSDKNYTVMIPISKPAEQLALASSQMPDKIENKTKAPVYSKSEIVLINGIRAIVAQKGDTKDKLALQAGISTRKFLRFNDLNSFEPINAGEAYYINAKSTKATVEYHTAQAGEKLRDIAQRYGMKANVIKRRNRMKKNETLVEGRVIWLMHTRPRNVPVEYRSAPPKLISPVLDINKNSTAAAPEKMPARPSHTTYQELELEPEQEVILAQTEPEEATEETEPEPENAAAASKPEATKPATAAVKNPTAKSEYPTQAGGPAAGTEKPVTTAVTSQPAEKPAMQPVQKTEPAVYNPNVLKPEPIKTETVKAAEKPASAKPAPVAQPKPEPAKAVEKPAPVKPATDPKPEKPAAPAPKAETHKVAQGETLYAISKKYEVTVEDLKNWNNLGASAISIGQVIRVAAPTTAGTTETAELVRVDAETVTSLYHTVAEGESMYQISRKYGVTIKEIMDWNNKKDFNVSMGEKLAIKTRQTAN